MTQDELWLWKYNEVISFIETNKRNPSKHNLEESGAYLTWIKHNRKLMNAGKMKEDSAVLFTLFLELSDRYRRLNQYA